jgi:TonB family protein
MNRDILEGLAGNLVARMGDASVRAAALAILTGMLALCLRKRPAAQHAVWGLVTLAMVVLPGLRPIVPVAHLHWTQPAALEAIRIGAVTDWATSSGGTSATLPLTQAAPSTLQLGWRSYLAIAYLAGVAIFVVRLMLGLFLGWRLLRDARSIGPELRKRFDLGRDACVDLEIEESNRVRVPVTAGLKRMRVILPADWREWPAEKMGAVLAHESAHVRRLDPLVALLAATNKCVFWFHPLAWWLERRLAVLAEHAADDAGLAVSHDAQSYARIVVEVASRMQENSGRLIWHAAAMNGPLIARRIRRVMDPRTRNNSGKLGVAARILLALSVGLLLWITTAADFQSLARAQDRRPAAADDGTRLGFKLEPSNGPEPSTPAEASVMEHQLANNPEDDEARAELLRYYWNKKMEEQRIPMILWLIDHHPESPLHGNMTAGIFPFAIHDRPGDADAFADARRRWWEQVNEHPQDARVLGNAAYALGAGSMRDEIDLLKRAQALDQENWTKPLAHLYSYVLVEDGELGTTREALGNPFRNSELAAQIRSELQTSDDIRLVGMTAFDVVELAVRKAGGHEGGNWDFAALRAIATELVRHAERLDPQNQHVLDVMGGSDGRWSDLMGGVKGLPATPVHSSAAPAVQGAPPASPQTVRIGEGVAASLLLESSQPIYPPLAKTAGVQGTVKLQVQIGTDGHVAEIKIVSGHPLLVPAAIDAVKSYAYKPFMVKGSAVDVITTVAVEFGADGAGETGAAAVAPQAKAPAEIKVEVAELNIDGATQVSIADRDQIAASIKERIYSYADPDGARDEVLERIRSAWQDRGYFKVMVRGDAKVQSSSSGRARIAVSAHVDEGEQYRLGGITFRNNQAISNSQARQLFPLKDDDIFSKQKVGTGLENFRKAYGELGYVKLTFIPDTKFDDKKKLIYLDVDVDEGKR